MASTRTNRSAETAGQTDVDMEQLPSWVRVINVPEQYRSHPLVQGKFFLYATQVAFNGDRWRELGRDVFDAKLLDLEYALSEVCRDHTKNVGFWGGQPIQYGLLRRLKMPVVPKALAESWGMKPSQVDNAFRHAERVSLWNWTVAGGYAGWLLACPMFLQEHLQLFQKWADEAARVGYS